MRFKSCQKYWEYSNDEVHESVGLPEILTISWWCMLIIAPIVSQTTECRFFVLKGNTYDNVVYSFIDDHLEIVKSQFCIVDFNIEQQ